MSERPTHAGKATAPGGHVLHVLAYSEKGLARAIRDIESGQPLIGSRVRTRAGRVGRVTVIDMCDRTFGLDGANPSIPFDDIDWEAE